jgi:hypothetical protein
VEAAGGGVLWVGGGLLGRPARAVMLVRQQLLAAAAASGRGQGVGSSVHHQALPRKAAACVAQRANQHC